MKTFKELSTEINEEAIDARLMLLVKNGLVDKEDISMFKIAFSKLNNDKPLTYEQKGVINNSFSKLIDIIMNDKMMYRKVKKSVQQKDDIVAEALAYTVDVDKVAKFKGLDKYDKKAKGNVTLYILDGENVFSYDSKTKKLVVLKHAWQLMNLERGF